MHVHNKPLKSADLYTMSSRTSFILPFHIYAVMNSSSLRGHMDSLKLKNLEIFCEDTAYGTSVCTIHPHLRVDHVCRLLTTLELHDINVDCYGLFDESLVY